MIFFRKISKGHISAKKEKQVELRFLFSARCLVMFYICTKFHENIFDGFKVIDRKRLNTKVFKGA